MAMYYYASKLNEVAACSGCHRKTPPPQPANLPLPHQQHQPTARSAGSYCYPAGSHSPPGITSSGKRPFMNGGASLLSPCTQQPIEMQPESQQPGGSGLNMVVSDVEYRDGQLVSGTLEALVDLLRPGADRSFLFAFLLCSRLCIRPHELLAMLCRRHTAPPQVTVPGAAGEAALAEMTSLIRLLGEWTRSFPYDFRDDRVMALLRTITQRCAAEDMASVRDEVSVMLQKLLDKLTALERYEESLLDVQPVSSTDQLPLNDIMFTGLTPSALARQLTLVELHRLSFVGPEEFVQAFVQPTVNKEDTHHHLPEPKKTRNLEAYAEWFNRLSYLVATDILKALKTKHRARVLEHWVLCARECFNLGNFNSLMAIVSALNMAPISRLKKTWSRCGGVAQQLPPLERCMEPGGNHVRYRSALAAAAASPQPAVPCFSVTCRDLHFINQAAPTRVSGNRINLDKCRALAKQVSEQLSRCHADTGVSRHENTWHYLLTAPVFSEHAMEIASFEREGPYDHTEKDRYKSLRHS